MLSHFYCRLNTIQKSFCISEFNPMLFRVIFNYFRLRHTFIQVLTHKETGHITRIISASTFPYNMINLSVLSCINSILIICSILFFGPIFYYQSLLNRTKFTFEICIRINDRTTKTSIHIFKQIRRIIKIGISRPFCKICRSTIFALKHFNKFQCRIHIRRIPITTVLIRNKINIPTMCICITLEIFTENIFRTIFGKE